MNAMVSVQFPVIGNLHLETFCSGCVFYDTLLILAENSLFHCKRQVTNLQIPMVLIGFFPNCLLNSYFKCKLNILKVLQKHLILFCFYKYYLCIKMQQNSSKKPIKLSFHAFVVYLLTFQLPEHLYINHSWLLYSKLYPKDSFSV